MARSLVSSGSLPSAGDADKVRYVLKNAARDWSDAGRDERDASYARVVGALTKALPPERGSAVGREGEQGDGEDEGRDHLFSPPRVLVPGCGLGRLCVDLVGAGFAAQGNEFSYYMLLASAFALNFCCGAGFEGGEGGEEGEEEEEDEEEEEESERPGSDAPPRESSGGGPEEDRGAAAAPGEEEKDRNKQRRSRGRENDFRPTIHPWVLTPCNWLRDADQLRGVRVPDVDPAAVVARAEERLQERRNLSSSAGPSSAAASASRSHGTSFPLLSMVAGDFAQVYAHSSRENSFDAVATCFFLDTAVNILDYIKAIKHVLVKNGKGIWVNLGPLLYHFADAASYSPGGGEGEEAPVSLELPLDEVLLAVSAAGFEITELKTDVPATFNATPRSMLRSGYACAQWTAVLKKEGAGSGE